MSLIEGGVQLKHENLEGEETIIRYLIHETMGWWSVAAVLPTAVLYVLATWSKKRI